MSKVQEKKIVYLFIFVLLIFPRSFQQFMPYIHYLINVLKGISVLFLTVYFIKKKQKFSLFSKCVFFYFGYLFLMTILNNESIINFFKSYYFNYGIILFGELIFKDKDKNFYIEKLADIFLIFNIVNLLCMIICKIIYGVYYFDEFYNTFLLGSDNRFILYIITPILAYNYLYLSENKQNALLKLIVIYIVGLLSLFFTWSAAALVVACLLFFSNVLTLYMKKKSWHIEFPIKVLIFLVFILNIGIVFFKIQNIFEFLIVDILHKSLHLSYRTYIWDIAINFLNNDFVRLIFGHGFFNTSELFTFTAVNSLGQEIILSSNHLHNLLINTLYFGGIVGTSMYAYFYYRIVKEVNEIKTNTYLKNILTIIFVFLNLLLIFDSFELYPVYYFILFLLYKIPYLIKREPNYIEQKKYQGFLEQKNTDKIGIMMATYNGEKYLKEQIESIINQSYTNWYLLISDDGSKDKTQLIIKEYVKKHPDKIGFIKNNTGKKGSKYNFANAFKEIPKCDYYMFSDQDDIWESQKISRLLYKMKNAEEVNLNTPILVYCDAKVVNKNLDIIEESLIDSTNKYLPNKNHINHFLIQNYFPGCTMMINNDLKKKILTIYDNCEMHDWWVALVAAYCGKIFYLDEALHLYRQHENNVLGAQKCNNFFSKSMNRLKKIFQLSKLKKTWNDYQNVVLSQAIELNKRYSKNEYPKSYETTEKLIKIMTEDQNNFSKICKLIFGRYTPSETIRIIRLVGFNKERKRNDSNAIKRHS